MNKRRPSSSYILTTALICSALISQVTPSFGGAGSVLDSTDPLKAAPPLQTRALGVGDMTVASRTGAFEYSYPLSLPPGRLGSQPSLALSYSSQGALRGKLAAGWSLGLPEIHLEITEGKGREEEGMFISSLSGGHRLVEVEEEPLKGFDQAYRAEIDGSYARYSMNADPTDRSTIVARTSDGTFYEFWNFRGADHENSTRWPLHFVIDKYGNKTEYEYEYAINTQDEDTNVLVAITYGANDNANLEDFARIEFRYNESETPCPGSTLITGASLTHRGPYTEIHGSKTLDRIDVLVKPSPGESYLHSRSYELSYDEDAASCDNNHGPLRVLSEIQEHAPKFAGDSSIGYLHEAPTQWISKPPVSFGYGPMERSWNDDGTTGLTFLGRGGRVDKTSNIGRVGSSERPSLKDMLLDFNGDGYVDRLSTVEVNDETTTCQMRVHLGDGGPNALKTLLPGVDADTLENVNIVNLPTLPWKLGAKPWPGDEDCSLSGQYTKHVTREGYAHCSNLGAYNSYRFMDMDADGLPDLVTEIWSDPLWFAAWDEESGVDISDLPPHTGTETGECPLLPRENFLAAEVCPTRDYCYFDQEMIHANIEEAHNNGDSVPCGVLYRQIRPDLGHDIPNLIASDGLIRAPEVGGEDDPDYCPISNDRGPEIRSGGYVWRWYKNTNGTLATTHNLTISPVPLVANGGDSTLGHGSLSSGSAHGLYDITGDGFIDAISIDFDEHWSDLQNPPPNDAVLNTNLWWVWPGDGKGGFGLGHWHSGFGPRPRPIAWHVPYRAATSAGEAMSFGGLTDPAGAEYWVSGTTSVQDVNGDGLPDMLKQDASGELRVHLNTGMGFRSRSSHLDPDLDPSTVDWPYGNGVEHTSFAATTDMGGGSGPQVFLEDAIRESRLMITDIDGDGLPDVYNKGSGSLADTSPQKFYGANDAKLLPAKQSQNDYPRRLMEANLAEWRLHHDLIDFNGDGVVDQIYGGPAGNPSSHKFKTDKFDGKPMRLLNHVNNGRGLTTEIRYAPGNAKSIAIDEDNIKGIPNHTWVVDTVSRSENLGGGAENSPDTVVSVKYGDAVWNRDQHGHWGFRGFEEIETSAPHEASESGFAVTHQDYDFDLDYSGRLVGTTAFVDGFPVHDGSDLVASIATTSWEQRAVVDGNSLSYVVAGEQSTVCADAQGFVSESVCKGMPLSGETRITHSGFLSSGVTAGGGMISAPIKTWTSAMGGYISDEQTDSLTQTTTMQLHYDDDTYQLVPTETNSFVGDGSTLVPTGHMVMNYSGDGRELVSQEAYRSVSDSLPAISQYGTNASTGNSISTTKPEQFESGLSTTQSFTGHQVYPSMVFNELGHRLLSYHDVGTGNVIRTRSQNQMDCATGSFQYEGAETTYDGFGRPIAVYQYGCDTSGSYAPLLMQSFKYFEFEGNGPASVTVSTVLDDTGAESESESYFDSYGRIVRTRSVSDGGDSNVHYHYGANGKLQYYDVPNPALNDDNERSGYTYRYDSLGRQLGVRVPDSTGVPPKPDHPEWDQGVGVDTLYGFESGLSTLTTIEVVQDGSSAGETKRYTNSLGQLVQVDERMSASSVAPTVYEYDGNGNMSYIVDADGIPTSMYHDWLSRRKAIVRGERKWEFEYDRNGNLVLETAPYPDSGIKMNYQSSYAFDALDRPTTTIAAVRELSPADQTLFGANIPVQYSYDAGDNGKGRLNSVSGPYFSRSYDYDDMGRIASETFDYDLSGTSVGGAVAGSKTRTFAYNRNGSPSHLNTAAGLSLQYGHDSAGRENSLTWENSNAGAINVATLTRNMAGSVIEHGTNSLVTRNWRYDQLGRVERTDVIRGNKTKLSEEMVYFDSNEVETLQVTRAGLADRTFSFGYDTQHQLVTASDDLEYDAAFTFSSSGSGLIENATVANIPGAPQVIARDVSYKYGNHQYVDAHTVETLNNSDGTPFATYLHDLSGNVTHREESGQGVDFEYDGEDRQRRASSSSNYSELYFYDEKGQRFLAIEIDPAGDLERSRMWFGVSEFWTNHKGGNIRTMTNLSLGALAVARVDTDDSNNTSLEYSFHNGLGHLMGTVDESGLLTTAFVYGPFGEIIEQSGAVDSHLRRFNGKEADQLSRLNYYGYRYYDPLSLQWTQADPLYLVAPDIAHDEPRRMGVYTFSLNNPLRYYDPDGRDVVLLGVKQPKTLRLDQSQVAAAAGRAESFSRVSDTDKTVSRVSGNPSIKSALAGRSDSAVIYTGHADLMSSNLDPSGNGTDTVSPSDFADAINGMSTSPVDILIVGCNTVDTGFAQEVSQLLPGVNVTAYKGLSMVDAVAPRKDDGQLDKDKATLTARNKGAVTFRGGKRAKLRPRKTKKKEKKKKRKKKKRRRRTRRDNP